MQTSPKTDVPFGKYLLKKRLAVGGMAELFLARDESTGKDVVIKRILPYLATEPEFVQMFLDEAKIAAQLHHPNIIQVLELGNLSGSIFIAMEYVEGADLRRVLQEELRQQQKLPYSVAAFVAAEVAAGLHHAHNAKGVDGRSLEVVHRDVSPQNVMVGFDGRVKLVDFGIAKAGAWMEASKPGVLKGKFLYLSPEQVAQQTLDHRADLFALGTLLYEISTGQGPFQKPTTEAVIYAIRAEEPAPARRWRPDFPAALWKIIGRCLEKDRDRRYQSGAELRKDLLAFIASQGNIDAPALGRYVANLFGVGDESTILHQPGLEHSSPSQSLGRRPTRDALIPELPPEPSTAHARPSVRPSAVQAPLPARRAASVRQDEPSITDSTSVPSESGAQGPPAVEARRRPGASTPHESDELSDTPLRPQPRRTAPAPRPRRGRLERLLVQARDFLIELKGNRFNLAAAVLTALLLLAVLVLALTQPRALPPAPTPAHIEVSEPTVAPEVSPPAPAPPPPPPVAAPSPKPAAPRRVAVYFKGNTQAAVTLGRQRFEVGKTYRMSSGKVTFQVRCPGSRRSSQLTHRIAPRAKGPFVVSVRCPH